MTLNHFTANRSLAPAEYTDFGGHMNSADALSGH